MTLNIEEGKKKRKKKKYNWPQQNKNNLSVLEIIGHFPNATARKIMKNLNPNGFIFRDSEHSLMQLEWFLLSLNAISF